MKTLLLVSTLAALISLQAFASAKYLYFVAFDQEAPRVFNLNMEPLYHGIVDTKRDTLVCTYKDAQGGAQVFEFGYNPCDQSTDLSIVLQMTTPQGAQVSASSFQTYQEHKSIHINAELSIQDGNQPTSFAFMAMSATHYQSMQSRDESLPVVGDVPAVTFDRALTPGRQTSGSLNCSVAQRTYECGP